jgi:hypothetical protein
MNIAKAIILSTPLFLWWCSDEVKIQSNGVTTRVEQVVRWATNNNTNLSFGINKARRFLNDDICIEWDNNKNLRSTNWGIDIWWNNNWNVNSTNWGIDIWWSNNWNVSSTNWNISIKWNNSWDVSATNWKIKFKWDNLQNWNISTTNGNIKSNLNYWTIETVNGSISVYKNFWEILTVVWSITIESDNLKIEVEWSKSSINGVSVHVQGNNSVVINDNSVYINWKRVDTSNSGTEWSYIIKVRDIHINFYKVLKNWELVNPNFQKVIIDKNKKVIDFYCNWQRVIITEEWISVSWENKKS